MKFSNTHFNIIDIWERGLDFPLVALLVHNKNKYIILGAAPYCRDAGQPVRTAGLQNHRSRQSK